METGPFRDHRLRPAVRVLCASIILLTSIGLSAAAGDRSAAFDDQALWLAANPTDPEFADRFTALIEGVATMAEVERAAQEVLPVVSDRALLSRAAVMLGRIAMTARDYVLAEELFGTAYVASAGTDLVSLYAQAQALMQLGRTAPAEQRARTVVSETDDFELKRRAYALVARAMHLHGRHREASRLLSTLADLDDPEHVEPETLILLSSVLVALDRPGGEPLDQLKRLHPQSAALRILEHASVEEAPLPVALLTGPPDERWAATGAGQASAPARTQEPRVSAIQVGSFSDAGNAGRLADELRALELDAHTEAVDRDGREMHLVLVRVADGTTDEAARAIAILGKAGYSGFLIY